MACDPLGPHRQAVIHYVFESGKTGGDLWLTERTYVNVQGAALESGHQIAYPFDVGALPPPRLGRPPE